MKDSRPRKQKQEQARERLSSAQAQRAERLAWLVDYSQGIDVPRDVGEIRRLHQQLGGYLGQMFIHCDGADHGGPHLVALGAPDMPDELPMDAGDNQKSFGDKIGLIRSQLRETLLNWLAPMGQPVRLEGQISLHRIVEGSTHHEERWVADDVRDAIKFKLLEDLMEVGTLLRRCPAVGCARLFVRHHRQEFCSSACRNRTNARRWFERHKKQAHAKGPRRVKKRAQRKNDANSN